MVLNIIQEHCAVYGIKSTYFGGVSKLMKQWINVNMYLGLHC